jgi:hypothetical protein
MAATHSESQLTTVVVLGIGMPFWIGKNGVPMNSLRNIAELTM